MAVRIIEYGRRRVKCSGCLSVLEFEKEDVKCKQTGMNEYSYYIKCPNCKEDINVPVGMSL